MCEQVFNLAINKGLDVFYCEEQVFAYDNQIDEDGVIRSDSVFFNKDGKPIKTNYDIDFLDRWKCFNKNGREVDEPRYIETCNVIYGPSTNY
jgi:hypothetical protein